jgi:hypothetical protein
LSHILESISVLRNSSNTRIHTLSHENPIHQTLHPPYARTRAAALPTRSPRPSRKRTLERARHRTPLATSMHISQRLPRARAYVSAHVCAQGRDPLRPELHRRARALDMYIPVSHHTLLTSTTARVHTPERMRDTPHNTHNTPISPPISHQTIPPTHPVPEQPPSSARKISLDQTEEKSDIGGQAPEDPRR